MRSRKRLFSFWLIGLAVGALGGCQGSSAPPSGDKGPAKTSSAPVATPATEAAAKSPDAGATGLSSSARNPRVDESPKAPAEKKADTGPEPSAPAAAKADAQQGPAKSSRFPTSPSGEILVEPPKMPDLGPPLVDHPENLTRLDPVYPVWIDKVHHQVVLVGQVSQPDYRLEFFACSDLGRGYESVVVVNTRASIVHAALLGVGAEPGHPVQFDPEYKPPAGQEIAVEVVWKDKDGRRRRDRAQDWVRNTQTKKPMQESWVFAGSGFWRDPTTGKTRYMADSGDLICMLSLPGAMMDLTLRTPSDLESRVFEADSQRVPPRGTPVTLLLTPRK
jgi:hypothetical protein